MNPVADREPGAEPPLPVAKPSVRVAFKSVFRMPVKDIALGRRGVIAVLSDEPWIDHGKKRWKKLKLPKRYRAKKGERERLRIFIGRDNLPWRPQRLRQGRRQCLRGRHGR